MEKLKRLLADAGRVLAHEGQGDYVGGHISLRLPDDPGLFLMKPAGIGLEEMTADNIITVNIVGDKVSGEAARHNEVFIHSEVMRARSDVQAVVHTHAVYAVVFSSLGKPLLPVSNDAAFFARVFVQNGVLAWPNGFDLDAIALHAEMKAAGLLRHATAGAK